MATRGPVSEEEALIRYGVRPVEDIHEFEAPFIGGIDYTGLSSVMADMQPIRPEQRFANHFHSSADLKPDACLRRTVYSLSRITPSDDVYNPDYQLTSQKGDLIHGDYQAAFAESRVALEYSDGKPMNEVTLDDSNVAPPLWWQMEEEWHISGRMDSVVFFRNRPAILDIKTVDNEKLYGEKKAVWWLKTVVQYFYQVQFYLKVFCLPTGESVKRGLIYVVNRDNLHDTRLYEAPANDDLLTLPLSDLAYAEQLRKQGKLFPKRPSDYFCRHMCEYFTICDPFDERKKAL